MGREEAQKPPTCSSLFGARISLRLAMEDFSRGKKGAASAASRASKSVVGGRGAVQPSKPSRCPQTLPPFLSSLASHSPVSSLPPPNPTQPNRPQASRSERRAAAAADTSRTFFSSQSTVTRCQQSKLLMAPGPSLRFTFSCCTRPVQNVPSNIGPNQLKKFLQ